MNFFKTNPFVRLLLVFIVGILVQHYLLPNKLIVISLFTLSIVAIVLVLFITIPYHLQHFRGLAITVFVFSCGVFVTNLHNTEFKPIESTKKVILVGEIIKPLNERERNYKTEIDVKTQKNKNGWQRVNTKVVAYIQKDSNHISLKAGNKIIFSTAISSIRSQQNPFGFNYARYLSLKQVNHVVYINNGNWNILSSSQVGFMYKALKLRQNVISIFRQNQIKGDSLAILSALSLGYKNTLDHEIRRAYSGAGVSHVLAVSGLHVGIIYLILYFALSWLTYFFKLKRLRYIIIIVALWGYAVLSALSPSVLRATVMFTFVLVGYVFNKKISIYNSLASSAFFLLLFNPFLLFDIGFQLSYTAVMGIVFFYPKIYKLLYFRYKIFDWIWSLTVVSIAAQLSTFPITAFYFHQFPLYFWVANIVVTLSAAILIFLAIVLISMSWFPAFSAIIGKFINIIIGFNINVIQWVGELPYSLVEGISISITHVFIFYILILSFAIWLVTKRYFAIVVSLLSVLLLGFLADIDYIKRENQSVTCVYQLKNETVIQFVDKSRSLWLTSVNKDKSQVNKVVYEADMYWESTLNTIVDANLTDTIIETDSWYFNSGYWASKNSKGLVISTNSLLPQIPKDTLFLDYLIVTGEPCFSFNDMSSKIVFNKIIIDGSVPYWKVRDFVQGNDYGNIFHTKKQGAFIALYMQ